MSITKKVKPARRRASGCRRSGRDIGLEGPWSHPGQSPGTSTSYVSQLRRASLVMYQIFKERRQSMISALVYHFDFTHKATYKWY
jgi:hypothetical protein